MTDLWPSYLESLAPARTPLIILKEQASLLGLKTRNLVEAQVVEVPRLSEDEPFAFDFRLVASQFGGYRFSLFRIYYGITLYPVRFRIDEDICREMWPESSEPFVRADSEQEFVQVLERLLGAEKTRRVIGALLAQSSGGEAFP